MVLIVGFFKRTIRSRSVKTPLLVRTFRMVWRDNQLEYSATVARDQEVDIPSQLELGVRLLQAQSHM